MTTEHDELSQEIRRALEAEADRVEVPEDLADRTLAVAREEEPSLLERARARRDARRAEGGGRTGPPKWAYGAAAAVLFMGFIVLGQLVTGEGGLEELARPPVETTDPDAAQEGEDEAEVGQEGDANSGESVAGSQSAGVVSEGGSTSVTGSDTSEGTEAESGDATVDNSANVQNGPRTSGSGSSSADPPEDDAPALAQGSGSLSPELIREAEIDVRVEEGRFQEARRQAEDVAEAHGGIVTSFSTTEEPGDEIARGTLLLRIPAERLQDAIGAYRDLGDLARLETSGTDVSGRLTDLDAQIRNAQAEEERLLELLDEADDVDDTRDIRRRIDDVREEIEELQADKQNLENEVDFSTVRLTVFEPGQEEDDDNPAPDGRLETAFGRGADVAATVLSGMLVAVLALAPVAAIGALVWGAVRLRRRRSAE